MRVSKQLLGAGLMACLSTVGFAASAAEQSPQLILAHGTILTLDDKDSSAQAIAIRNGKILKVGVDADVLSLADNRTRILDLHGRTATPGLIDTHAHVADGGLSQILWIQLGDADSIDAIVERVKEKAAALKPGEWVLGEGWDEGKLRERRYVTAADLDAVARNNPVWLGHTTGHYGTANSYALKLAKISAQTPNPPAGTIDRDASGQPTGVLKEDAMDLITQLPPDPTPDDWQKGILKMLESLHREGMTAFKDPSISKPVWDAYSALVDRGKLSAHVCVLWYAGKSVESAQATANIILSLPRPPASIGRGRLLSCGAKLYMDGSGGGRTAWMYDDWSENWTGIDKGNKGYPAEEPEVYRQMVALLSEAGINIGTHAIGDRAIDWVVDTYARELEAHPVRGLRHSIIHANLPTDHAIAVMQALQQRYDAGYPEMQPPFMWWIGDNYAGNLGPKRAERLEPFRTLLARGVQWTGGSDFAVTPIAARHGLWAATTRETLKGIYGPNPFGISERVDAHAALKAYTSAAARQLFLERQIGSLEPGKDADIAVWDLNPYKIPPASLEKLHCEMTIFEGTIVYEARQAAVH